LQIAIILICIVCDPEKDCNRICVKKDEAGSGFAAEWEALVAGWRIAGEAAVGRKIFGW
jgi:hypothetical protein